MREKEIDRLIREALEAEETEVLEALDEPSLLEMVSDTFRGRTRWLTVLNTGITALFTLAMFYCAWRFFTTEAVRESLDWMLGVLFSGLAVSLIKLMYWVELNRIASTRELKRVELQLVRMASRAEG